MIRRVGISGQKAATFLFRCDCGKEVVCIGCNVKHGCTRSCGCARRKITIHAQARRSILRSYQSDATERGYAWALPDELFDKLLQGECFYCGKPPSCFGRIRFYKEGNFLFNGIDRLNNSEGYYPNNVVSCCALCNRNKGKLSKEAFLDWIASVWSWQQKKKCEAA